SVTSALSRPPAECRPSRPLFEPIESPTEESVMATTEKPPALTPEQADSQEVLRLVSEGKRVTDPELRRRIHERAETVRREIQERFGVVEWAVEMIRDARDE